MSNLTDVIGRSGFAYTGTVTVTRIAGPTDDGFGRSIPGATSAFTLAPVGVIPGSSKLNVLPDGYSAENVVTIYTTTRLVKLPYPDRVTITPPGGVAEVYAVVSVQGPWTGFDGTHWVVQAARLASPGTD